MRKIIKLGEEEKEEFAPEMIKEKLLQLFSDKTFIERVLKNPIRRSFMKLGQKAILSEQDLEDLVSDVFLRILRIIDGGNSINPGLLKFYCISSMKNAALDLYRSRKRRPMEQLQTGDVSAELVAEQGMGSYPSRVEDRILVKEMDKNFQEFMGRSNIPPEEMRNLLNWYGGIEKMDSEKSLKEWGETPAKAYSFVDTNKDVAKEYLKKYQNFDWDAEMAAAQAILDPQMKKEKIQELKEMLSTTQNSIYRRISRTQERFREKVESSLVDLSSLVKVANRLDALGLTSEADCLDLLIQQMAQI